MLSLHQTQMPGVPGWQDVAATEAALRTGVKLAHDAAAGAKMDTSQQVPFAAACVQFGWFLRPPKYGVSSAPREHHLSHIQSCDTAPYASANWLRPGAATFSFE